MSKIHVVLKKEDIISEKLKGQVAIVLDVLLATTTIAACLESGATEVIPVLDENAALKFLRKFHPDEFILIGEKNGRVLDGFIAPNPIILSKYVKGKSVILATTNGTVALRRSEMATKLYAGSLRNGEAIVQDAVKSLKPTQDIIVICSGSQGQFCLEDFYGAGYLVTCFNKLLPSATLTDGALASRLFYQQNHADRYQLLASSAVGKFLLEHNCEEDLQYVIHENCDQNVPIYDNCHIVWKEEKEDGTVEEGNEGWTLPR
ncbi:2-phosphosulfolactate phosphatase [Halalkalibacter alkalisediminis]|uniref:Probable 2-phosphosulfolactate phosphatase n=1 Tax=Halalkalibacter alkalisediminis TaxID=935616 RepID=A0ABV6ND00_9BACI|nr:2-phosphosulfolactate phosphatase [Halalkalibacter alkalisediminis]